MFWQTGAFKAIAVVSGFAVLWLLIKYRMTLIYARIRDRWAARVAERERIARELHDSFLQGIQGLLLRFNTVARSMPPESPTRKSMEEALGLSNEIMLTGRRLLQDLRDTSRAATLSEELEAIGRGFQGLYATEFSMSSLGKERPIDPFVTDELFKVGREAISNAFRHSQARSILVALEFRDRDLKLLIRDNGVGIEERLLIEGKKAGHWGLPGMRERVAQLNGNIRFESRHGIGTTVEVKIPAHRAYRRRQVRLSRWLSLIGDNDRYLE
jgi:signal transduction histidine kinase